MRLFKKAAALLLAVTLAIPAMSVSASAPSPEKKNIVGVDAESTYNDADQSDLIKFQDENDGTDLVKDTDYTITNIEWVGYVKTGDESTKQTASGADLEIKNAGVYTVTAEGMGAYTGTATATITINKAASEITAKKDYFLYRMKNIYTKTLTVPVKATSNSGEAVTYSLTKYGVNRGFSIDASTGVVTHPENAVAKYKYGEAHVYASVDESLNYKAARQNVATIFIKKCFPHFAFETQRKTVSYADVKAGNVTYDPVVTGEPGTKPSFTAAKPKYISVSKTGVVTVKKGTPKGKYKITVINTNTSQYYPGRKNFYVIVK